MYKNKSVLTGLTIIIFAIIAVGCGAPAHTIKVTDWEVVKTFPKKENPRVKKWKRGWKDTKRPEGFPLMFVSNGGRMIHASKDVMAKMYHLAQISISVRVHQLHMGDCSPKVKIQAAKNLTRGPHILAVLRNMGDRMPAREVQKNGRPHVHWTDAHVIAAKVALVAWIRKRNSCKGAKTGNPDVDAGSELYEPLN